MPPPRHIHKSLSVFSCVAHPWLMKDIFPKIESTLIKRIMEFFWKIAKWQDAVYYCGKIKRDGEAQSKIKIDFFH